MSVLHLLVIGDCYHWD